MCEHTSKNMIEAYNSLFDTRELYLPQYVFRSTEIEFGASVLLYGAGKVGKEYYYQLKAEINITLLELWTEMLAK